MTRRSGSPQQIQWLWDEVMRLHKEGIAKSVIAKRVGRSSRWIRQLIQTYRLKGPGALEVKATTRPAFLDQGQIRILQQYMLLGSWILGGFGSWWRTKDIHDLIYRIFDKDCTRRQLLRIVKEQGWEYKPAVTRSPVDGGAIPGIRFWQHRRMNNPAQSPNGNILVNLNNEALDRILEERGLTYDELTQIEAAMYVAQGKPLHKSPYLIAREGKPIEAHRVAGLAQKLRVRPDQLIQNWDQFLKDAGVI